MKLHMPTWYTRFVCSAGDCPDTCCSRWEVIVDAETRRRYEALPGPLGERVRAALRRDEDGESYLAFPEGHCPMLTGEGLCALQKEYGEGMLSLVCNRYPRFRYEFGAVAELGVSISCPAACELVLKTPFCLTEESDPALPSPNDILPERWLAFSAGRVTALRIASDGRFCVSERTALLLCFAEELERTVSDPRPVLEAWRPETLPARLAAIPRSGRGRFGTLLRVFSGMEFLTERFPAALGALSRPAPFPDEGQAQRLLEYFLYKYFLQAAYDGKLLKKVQFSAAMLLLLGALCVTESSGALPERVGLIHLCSREIEHSEENLARFAAWAGRKRQALLLQLLLEK